MAFLISTFFVSNIFPVQAQSILEQVKGQILLQVEDKGQAWYVQPVTGKRFFMYQAEQAFEVMRNQGVGIMNSDLSKIAIGLDHQINNDTDQDGLSDEFEVAIGTDSNSLDSDQDGFSDYIELEFGYDPLGSGRLELDQNFAETQAGRIFLQVESNGEAWWVNPKDHRRYFLGRPDDALALMRSFGLGITDNNLALISITNTLMDCEIDMACFLASAQVDQPVKVDYILDLDFIGTFIHSRTLLEFVGPDYSGLYTYSTELLEATGEANGEVAQGGPIGLKTVCTTKNQDSILEIIQNTIDGNLKTGISESADCYSPTHPDIEIF
ncbi:thrombospondin type 3 repeat-containing protein [Patescibacteria group bacterium]